MPSIIARFQLRIAPSSSPFVFWMRPRLNAACVSMPSSSAESVSEPMRSDSS